MKKTIMALFAILFFSVCFLSASFSFSEELMPEPGTVIDKTNIKKYAHLFPEEFLSIFEDGFGGLMEPASITVGEPITECTIPKEFLALSAENKGKYSLDSDGNLIGGWNRTGFPFPDLQRDDQDFVTKLMWNFAERFDADDSVFYGVGYMKRKGEKARRNRVMVTILRFTNRTTVPPIPILKTQNDVSKATHFLFKEPSSMKHMQNLSLRYMDLQKPDETYIYVPSLRRVLRGDSGQRSVPLQGNLAALDDLGFFDGKTEQFTFKLVREQTVLIPLKDLDERLVDPKGVALAASDGWFPLEVYVIDIVSKNPTYPQSKKRIWMDKNTLTCMYCATWDRAGKLWKVWHVPYMRFRQGDTWLPIFAPIVLGVDLQFGMLNGSMTPAKINRGGLSYEDVAPSALVKKAR